MATTRKWRFIISVVLLLALGGFLYWYQNRPKPLPKPPKLEELEYLELDCLGSPEKTAIFADEAVAQVLLEQYHIVLHYHSDGWDESYQMSSEELEAYDCLWPSSTVSAERFARQQGKEYRTEPVFYSPLVIYSWQEPVEALLAGGYAEDDQGWLTLNLPKLVEEVIRRQGNWAQLGTMHLRGEVRIKSTDPQAGGAAELLYLLLWMQAATADSQSEVLTVETGIPVLAWVSDIYLAQGMQAIQPAYGFESLLVQGMGAYPMYVGYESQALEASVANPERFRLAAEELRVLYPEPTLWADHPLAVFDRKHYRLFEAVRDPRIQAAAWSIAGLRPGNWEVVPIPQGLPVAIAAKVDRVAEVPSGEWLELLAYCLESGDCDGVIDEPVAAEAEAAE